MHVYSHTHRNIQNAHACIHRYKTTYFHTCTHSFLNTDIHVHIYQHSHTYICTWTHKCVYAFIYPSMELFIYPYVYVPSTFMHMYIYTYYIDTFVYTYMHTLVHAHLCTYLQIRIHRQSFFYTWRISLHVCIHTHWRSFTPLCLTRIHKYVYFLLCTST